MVYFALFIFTFVISERVEKKRKTAFSLMETISVHERGSMVLTFILLFDRNLVRYINAVLRCG